MLVACLLVVPYARAAPTDPYLFYAEQADSNVGIYKQNLTTGVTTRISTMERVGSLALDATNDHLYVARQDPSTFQYEIVRMDLEAAHEVVIASNLGTDPIWGMALHVPNQQIYFTTYYSSASIRRVNFDGTNMTDLIAGLKFPHGIDIDRVHSKLYFIEYGYGDLMRANLDGSSVETLVNKGDWEIAGISVDAINNKMYYAPFGAGDAYRADLDGSNETTIISGFDGGAVLRAHLPTSKLYYAQPLSLKIKRADVDGSNQQDLHSLSSWTTALDVSDGLDFPSDVTPTPTVTPTATPTETNAVPANTLDLTILDPEGRPISGAVVAIELAGSFISNRGGEVIVTRVPRDVEAGRTLGVRVAKEGYVFAHTTITTGEKKSLMASFSHVSTTATCTKREFGSPRAEVSKNLTRLYLNSYEAIEEARRASKGKGNQAFERQFTDYKEKIVSSLNLVQSIELTLPTQSLSCPRSRGLCREVLTRRSLQQLLSAGSVYVQFTSHTTKAMTNRGGDTKRARHFLAKARALRKALSEAIRSMPNSAGQCE